MAVQTETATPGRNWYACTPDEVAAAVGVDPAAGLPAARAAELLAENGPNSLPEEKAKPGWLRFLDQYRSYMQIILIAAAVLVTQMDVFNRLLGTTQLNLRQFSWALIPALALLVLWELGKYIARRVQQTTQVAATAVAS
jgi:magnesium-transporting ATPase (P-type)